LEEKCPYCSVTNETAEISIGHRAWASFLGWLGYEGSSVKTVRSLRIDCIFCQRHFTLLKFEDYDWVKDRLIWDDTVRVGMIEIYGTSVTRDNILSNITGVALRSDNTIDICFKKNKKRAYLSCVKGTTGYKVVNMEEIVFG